MASRCRSFHKLQLNKAFADKIQISLVCFYLSNSCIGESVAHSESATQNDNSAANNILLNLA